MFFEYDDMTTENLFEFKEAFESDGMRHYIFEERDFFSHELIKIHDYPSVTSVISSSEFFDNSHLEEWKQRIGEDKAKEIVDESITIGNYLHHCYEFIDDEENRNKPQNKLEEHALKMYKLTKKHFKNIFTEAICREQLVFSRKLRIAGRTDAIYRTNSGKIALVDFKNSKGEKGKNDIEKYKIQLSFYNRMAKESLGIQVDELVVFMVFRNGFSKIFRFDTNEVDLKTLAEIRKRFYIKRGF